MEYPPLLTAEHIAHILSCHEKYAYKFFEQPHRPVWRHGKMVRMHRDEFLRQLAEEAAPKQQTGT